MMFYENILWEYQNMKKIYSIQDILLIWCLKSKKKISSESKSKSNKYENENQHHNMTWKCFWFDKTQFHLHRELRENSKL